MHIVSLCTPIRGSFSFVNIQNASGARFIVLVMSTALAARAAPAKPAIKTPPIPPNQTLYVTNLPSAKINKSDLKTALYLLFSTYGPVLDVIALKTAKMRGQAHIVFRDTHAATQAMRSLEGFQFLGKELVCLDPTPIREEPSMVNRGFCLQKIQYAKSKSDTIAKLDGTYKLPGSAAANVEMTEIQQSIFNAPAPTSSTTSVAPPSHTLPPKPPQVTNVPIAKVPSPDNRGQKRPRDEEEEEEESDEDVAMEEDSDDE
ncbi:hypothetical protein FHL15_000820 [Xylaria flabelliformis]|uniref:RRM domain-containing protein n=1 Tax=Xylaria flabelliformis TaxID=2512241 RepID=A0A553ID90_9PEZI|nr:hypothetical protein FHL15_000820 [Xylaria flabelliformis]